MDILQTQSTITYISQDLNKHNIVGFIVIPTEKCSQVYLFFQF